MQDPAPGIEARPHEDNLRYFEVTILGPMDSPYESTIHRLLPISTAVNGVEGRFQLELFLPEDYPMGPPKVRFLTRIYHPNIDKLGRICLDILKGCLPPCLHAGSLSRSADKWSPALQIRTVLLSIQALMGAPNPDDPLANDVAQHWKTDEKAAIDQGTLVLAIRISTVLPSPSIM